MATDSSHRVLNSVTTFSRLFFYQILFIFAGYDDLHKSSDELEISARSDHSLKSYLLLRVRKNPHRLIWEKRCLHIFSAVFDQILLTLAGNEDMNKSSLKPEDHWSCKRSPDILTLVKHKTYKTWKIYGKEMTLSFNTHITS